MSILVTGSRGHVIRQVVIGPPVEKYLRRIDATLQPFGGNFIVDGGEIDVLEGSWTAAYSDRAVAHRQF